MARECFSDRPKCWTGSFASLTQSGISGDGKQAEAHATKGEGKADVSEWMDLFKGRSFPDLHDRPPDLESGSQPRRGKQKDQTCDSKCEV